MEANRKNSHSPSAEQDREGAVIYYLVPKKQGKFGVPKNVRHSAPPFAPRLQLRFRSSAKSIAACRMHL